MHKRAEFQRSPILGVLLYLCLHPLTENDQIQHGITLWGEACFRSATPLQLHKCVKGNAAYGLGLCFVCSFVLFDLFVCPHFLLCFPGQLRHLP